MNLKELMERRRLLVVACLGKEYWCSQGRGLPLHLRKFTFRFFICEKYSVRIYFVRISCKRERKKNDDAFKQPQFGVSEVSMVTIGYLFIDHKVIMVRWLVHLVALATGRKWGWIAWFNSIYSGLTQLKSSVQPSIMCVFLCPQMTNWSGSSGSTFGELSPIPPWRVFIHRHQSVSTTTCELWGFIDQDKDVMSFSVPALPAFGS